MVIRVIYILTYVFIRNIIIGENMKVSELIKLLKKNGAYLTMHGREHDEWYSPITKKYFRVPRHKSKELPNGTASRIMKDAGLKK